MPYENLVAFEQRRFNNKNDEKEQSSNLIYLF